MSTIDFLSEYGVRFLLNLTGIKEAVSTVLHIGSEEYQPMLRLELLPSSTRLRLEVEVSGKLETVFCDGDEALDLYRVTTIQISIGQVSMKYSLASLYVDARLSCSVKFVGSALSGVESIWMADPWHKLLLGDLLHWTSQLSVEEIACQSV